MRRAPGNQRPKKGSAARSSRPPGRAAERAGLKPGDLVTELDGTPVRDAADLHIRLALLRTGEVAEFAVSRPGGTLTVRAEMAEREPAARSR
jgi:S1-C subfamily serine protease